MDLVLVSQTLYHFVAPALAFAQNNPVVVALAALNLLVVGLRIGISRELNRAPVAADGANDRR